MEIVVVGPVSLVENPPDLIGLKAGLSIGILAASGLVKMFLNPSFWRTWSEGWRFFTFWYHELGLQSIESSLTFLGMLKKRRSPSKYFSPFVPERTIGKYEDLKQHFAQPTLITGHQTCKERKFQIPRASKRSRLWSRSKLSDLVRCTLIITNNGAAWSLLSCFLSLLVSFGSSNAFFASPRALHFYDSVHVLRHLCRDILRVSFWLHTRHCPAADYVFLQVQCDLCTGSRASLVLDRLDPSASAPAAQPYDTNKPPSNQIEKNTHSVTE